MLGKYKYSREIIVNYINECPVTPDGNIICKNFRNMNNEKGLIDDRKYFFNRNIFEDKIIFNQAEIEAYLEEEKSDFNVEEMLKKDLFINDIIRGSLSSEKNTNELLEGEMYSLNELVDTSIFMYYSKYSL